MSFSPEGPSSWAPSLLSNFDANRRDLIAGWHDAFKMLVVRNKFQRLVLTNHDLPTGNCGFVTARFCY